MGSACILPILSLPASCSSACTLLFEYAAEFPGFLASLANREICVVVKQFAQNREKKTPKGFSWQRLLWVVSPADSSICM